MFRSSLHLGLLALINLISCVNIAQAGLISVCPSRAGTQANAEQLYDAQGTLVTLAVSEAVPQGECATLELPVSAAQIRWLALNELPPKSPPSRLVLQGQFAGQQVDVSEVIHASTDTTQTQFLAINENLLAHFTAFTFGEEERALFTDANELQCAAGTRNAGVVLQSRDHWPLLNGAVLELSVRGEGKFEVAIADAAQQLKGASLPIGNVGLEADANTVSVGFTLPATENAWSSVTLLCPHEASSLALEDLRLQLPRAATVLPGRAGWFWAPTLWQQTPELIWQQATAAQLQRLYITVPIAATGEVSEPQALAAFINKANERGLAVWAVTGDRHDVLPNNLAPLLGRIKAYQHYNDGQSDKGRLGGVQLDIEPYLLPGFALGAAYWRDRYLQTIRAVQAELDEQLPLDLVIPVWWGSHHAFGQQFFAGLPLGLSVTVMNYRTDTAQLRAGALPFLDWAERSGNQVAMALETGTATVLGSQSDTSELRRYYERNDNEGSLWVFDLNGSALLVLLDSEYSGLPGHAYQLIDETRFDIGEISFAGDVDWQPLASALELEWSAWPGFSGLAIHGLDQQAAADE